MGHWSMIQCPKLELKCCSKELQNEATEKLGKGVIKCAHTATHLSCLISNKSAQIKIVIIQHNFLLLAIDLGQIQSRNQKRLHGLWFRDWDKGQDWNRDSLWGLLPLTIHSGGILILLGSLSSFAEVSQLQETQDVNFSLLQNEWHLKLKQRIHATNEQGISTSLHLFQNLKELTHEHRDRSRSSYATPTTLCRVWLRLTEETGQH